MTCPCRPCVTGSPVCARILLLSPKDDFDATRLWRRFAEHGVSRVNLKTSPSEQRARAEQREPSEPVLCRSCGASFAMPVYLVAFLREYRAPTPTCTTCHEAA